MKKIFPFISLVIPLYNEEDNVRILYQEIRKAVDHLRKPYEIIFVDDGSQDQTFDAIKTIKENEDNLKNNRQVRTRIIRLSRNFGQTAAMQAGFDYASGEIIVSLDGDLQNDPADIPKLLAKLEEGYDLVFGWRKERKDKMFTRVIPSRIANWIIRKLTGIPIHDCGCSLKAYKSNIIKSLRLYSDMHRFIPAITSILSPNVTEIEVNHRARRHGNTKYGLSRVWIVFLDMITIKMLIEFFYHPIRWFTGFGGIFFLCGLGTGIGSVYLFINGQSVMVLGTVSILLFTLFGGFLSWGILAEFFLWIENRITFYDNFYNLVITEVKR